jgi:hypothetical protein
MIKFWYGTHKFAHTHTHTHSHTHTYNIHTTYTQTHTYTNAHTVHVPWVMEVRNARCVRLSCGESLRSAGTWRLPDCSRCECMNQIFGHWIHSVWSEIWGSLSVSKVEQQVWMHEPKFWTGFTQCDLKYEVHSVWARWSSRCECMNQNSGHSVSIGAAGLLVATSHPGGLTLLVIVCQPQACYVTKCGINVREVDKPRACGFSRLKRVKTRCKLTYAGTL